MPIYPLSCPSCGAQVERYASIQLGKLSTGCSCGGTLKRVWTPTAVPKAFQPHYNVAVGRYVNTMREFKDALKEGGERQFQRTGIETNFVAVDSGDKDAFGVSDNPLDETHRRARKAGLEQRSRFYSF